ncbi:MAG: hypothetical protein RIQ93_2078 [Verrucomicrobiota bacterium]|jgi:hypothetical protein
MNRDAPEVGMSVTIVETDISPGQNVRAAHNRDVFWRI